MRTPLRPRVLLCASYNGLSEMVTQLSVGVTTFLFNLMTFAYMGEDGVAAISVILYAEMLLTSLLLGFTNGVAPVFSYHYGARRGGELLRLLRLALVIIGIAGVIAYGTARVLGAPLTALFLPQGGHVAVLTLDGFSLFSLSFLLCGFNIFTAGFFTALSNGRTSALCSLLRNLVGIAIFLFALPHFLGARGIWLAVPASDLVALAVSLSHQRPPHTETAQHSCTKCQEKSRHIQKPQAHTSCPRLWLFSVRDGSPRRGGSRAP